MTQQYRIEIDTPYFDRGKTISAFALSQEGVEPDKFTHIFKPMFEIENKELVCIDDWVYLENGKRVRFKKEFQNNLTKVWKYKK